MKPAQAPIYRAIERLLQWAIPITERLPKSLPFQTLGGEMIRDIKISLDGKITANTLAQLRHDVCSINSYLGFMIHTASYRMRAKIFKRECRAFWKICYTRQFAVCKVKEKYDIKQFLINQEIQNYGMDLHRDRATAGRKKDTPRHEATHRQLQHRNHRRRHPNRLQVQTPSRNP